MSVCVRPLSAPEARLLTAARLVAVEHAPYLAHALFATRPVTAEGLETFAVDRGWRLYLDAATLAGWGPSLAGGVLVHEVRHLVARPRRTRRGARRRLRPRALERRRRHEHQRRPADGQCAAAGGALTPAAFGLAEGGIEEAYYAVLAQQSCPTPNGAGPEVAAGPGCGCGAGESHAFRALRRGNHLTDSRGKSPDAIADVVLAYAAPLDLNVAAHDCRRTFAKLALKGGARLEQIQLSMGHQSIQTTPRYLGVELDLQGAPCDHLGLTMPAL